METLTYGRKKPESGDDSLGVGGWMEAIEANIELDDAHTHDGVNSPRIDSRAISAYTAQTGTGWASRGNGLYEISMSMPSGLDFDEYSLAFRDASGNPVMLDYERVDASNFKVITNNNTVNYTVLFTS